jgi:hypothetical protein
MPKIISKGKIIIDGKEYNREDFDDTRSGHTHLKEDGGFFGHMTHASMQGNEESVKVSGDGFHDSSVPKKPITDCFYHNVSNWKR